MLQQPTHETRQSIAEKFVDSDKGINSFEDAISGARDIIAENISDNADYRKEIRKFTFDTGILVSKAPKDNEKTVYDMYYDF